MIHPESPNIFEKVTAPLAISPTRLAHAQLSYQHITEAAYRGELHHVPFEPEVYGNSGVVLYTKEAAHAFSPEQITAAKECLHARFPHQTLFYYLHRLHGVEVQPLRKMWNRSPGRGLSTEERQSLTDASRYINKDHNRIMHFTGYYTHRGELVKQLAQTYRGPWRSRCRRLRPLRGGPRRRAALPRHLFRSLPQPMRKVLRSSRRRVRRLLSRFR